MKSNPIMTNQTSNDEQPMPAVTTTTTTTTTTTMTTTITTSTSSETRDNDSTSNEQALLEAAFAKMRDQEEFFKRLVEFHKHKNVNTAIHKLPSVNGRTLDLRALYNRVVSAGGWERVCEKNRWSELAADLDPIAFKSCVNGAHALKLIYIRYLSVFEKFDQQTQYSANASKVNLQSLLDPLVNLNPVNQPSGTSSVMFNPALTGIPASYNNLLDLNGTDDTDINRRKFSHLIELAPMTYNHSQHSTTLNSAATSFNNIFASPFSSPTSATTTTTSTMSSATTKPVSWAFEPIMLSLLCGLPNEVDFVFNMLIHLSSDDKNPLKLSECERLVDLMLAHVGFFGANDKYQLRSLYDLVWNAPEFDQEEKENNKEDADQESSDVKMSLIEKFARYGYSEFVNEYMSSLRKMRRRCFVLFWHNGVELPDKNCVIKSSVHASSNLCALLESLLPKLYNTHLNEFPSPDLLNMREGDLVRSVEYRRLEQAMIILNNLSFDEINADMMANKSPALFEFLIVATFFTSREPYVNLKRHSLDILANVAKKMRLKRLSAAQNSLLVGTLHQLIVDQEHDDRLDLIRALEILSKLCGRELGEDDSTSNEKILGRYEIMNDVLNRMESLLTSQDVLVVLHALECLYNMTQCSRDLSPPQRLVPILVNFLTLDISHFGGQAVDNPVVNTYASTLVTNAHAAFHQQQHQQQQIFQQQQQQQQQQIYQQQQQQLPSQQPKIVQASVINGKTVIKTASPAPSVQIKPSTPNLLHQTLQQQHALNVNNQGSATTTTTTTNTTATATGLIKINTTAMPPLSPTATSPGSSTLSGKAEEEARNWLVTSFQPDRTSEISKTQLYAHYQHIAKIKGWTVLTIPTFFDILYVTFPNVRLNEETNKLTGLKLDPLTSRKPTNEKPTSTAVTSVALTTKTASPVVVVNTAGNSSDSTKSTIVKKEDSSASPFSSLLSPPPTVSVSVYNQASPMALPLLTPPSPPPARSNTSVQPPSSSSSTSVPAADQVPTKPIVNPAESTATPKENSSEDSKPVVNGNPEHSNTNQTAASSTNPSMSEILNQNEDSTSSMSSSSSTMSSASTSSSKSSSSSSSSSTPTATSCAENIKKRKLEDEVKQVENNPNQVEPVKAPPQPPTPVVESKPIEKPADTEMIDTSTTREPTPQAVTTASTDADVLAKKHKPMDTVAHVEPAVVKVPEFVNIGDYMCEWNGCNRMFPTSKAVYNHVCKYHLLNETNDVPSHGYLCRWSNGCDQVRRQKWSLVNHLMERHCNENAMRTAIICRQRSINQVLNHHPTPFINYSPDAAQIAIQRNQKIRREDFYSCDEGPITKSIRLLAALSLRNLARNCEQSKKLIRTYEAELTNVAFDLLEASNALTNCLWYLHN